jgi:hypothetical protein
MATIIRRYFFKGPWPKHVREVTDPGATFPWPVPCYYIANDVEFDDAIADVAAVDESMRQYGCFPDMQNTRVLSPNPFIGIQSPDGSAWKLEVDDLGVLTIVKVS